MNKSLVTSVSLLAVMIAATATAQPNGIGSTFPDLPFSIQGVKTMDLTQSALNSTVPINVSNGSFPSFIATGSGTDVGLLMQNTGPNGRAYYLSSGSQGSGVGDGAFGIWDGTARAARFTIAANGNMGINTISPSVTFDMHATAQPTVRAVSDTLGDSAWFTLDNDKSPDTNGEGFAFGLYYYPLGTTASPYATNPSFLINYDRPIGAAASNIVSIGVGGDMAVSRAIKPGGAHGAPFTCDNVSTQGSLIWGLSNNHLCACNGAQWVIVNTSNACDW